MKEGVDKLAPSPLCHTKDAMFYVFYYIVNYKICANTQLKTNSFDVFHMYFACSCSSMLMLLSVNKQLSRRL